MKNLLISILLFLGLSTSQLLGQETQAFYYLNYPQSVSTFGIGMQGVASLSSDDAMVFNPANLARTNKIKFSFFHQPFQMLGFASIPLDNFELNYRLEKIGTFGIRYNKWDFGEVGYSSADNPLSLNTFHFYQSSFALGFARNINDEFSAGIQFTYAYRSDVEAPVKNLSFSLGLYYSPHYFNKKLNIGFSLMNLSDAIKYDNPNHELYLNYSDPPPTQLNLGVHYIAIENNYFSLPVELSFSKPFDKKNGLEAQSSFKSLFNDWNDFPRDATLHTGLEFIWKPVNLGKGYSYFQEIFIGNSSDGPKTIFRNFYTHGINFGLASRGIALKAGYAGIWHNVEYPKYMPWIFPYEMVQFSIQVNNGFFVHKSRISNDSKSLSRIILSAGAGRLFGLGNTDLITRSFQTSNPFEMKYTTSNSTSYSFEADFYLNSRNALVAKLSYSSIPTTIKINTYTYKDTKSETVSLFSGFRYHPAEDFRALFVEGGISIFRFNPVYNYYTKYFYQTALQFSTGLLVRATKDVFVIPELGYNIMLTQASGNVPRLAGYNHLYLGLKIGYRL